MRFVSAGLLIGMLLAVCSDLSAAQLKTSDIVGVNKCGFTMYSWPKSAAEQPMEVAEGSLWDQGDGKGNWIRGSAKFVVKPQNKACQIDVEKGTYMIDSDGTVTSTITWKVKDEDPVCGQSISQFATGQIVNSPATTSVVKVYQDQAGAAHQLSFGSAGFTAGTCELGTK